MKLQYLKHEQINRQGWDACIGSSPIPMIYAYSAYLDIIAPGWDAIVLGDYNTVMPIPHRKKLQIHYVFRPVLTQQLGVFGGLASDKETVETFISFLEKHFRYADMPLNTMNPSVGQVCGLGVTHYLPLSDNFETIEKKFATNHKRNIAKALREGLCFSEHNHPEALAKIMAESPDEWIQSIDKQYASEMLNAIEKLVEKGIAKLYAIKNSQGNPIAMAVFSEYQNQINYLFGISNQEGKTNSAMFLMFQGIIEQYAGTGKQLDFEGSETESIARFFRGFGGIQAQYAKIRINRLPTVVKFLKNKKK